jgi:peptidylprolyl isomerase
LTRIAARLLAVGVAAATVTSCTPEAPLAPAPTIEETTFATSLGINLAAMTKMTNGIYYQDTPAGSGAAAVSGNHLTVHYTGYLPNGTSFDTSVGKSPFGFTLGEGAVIQGWEQGLVGMKVGGTRKLIIPPSLGYGAVAQGSIPANSILVFTVQLISIP